MKLNCGSQALNLAKGPKGGPCVHFNVTRVSSRGAVQS